MNFRVKFFTVVALFCAATPGFARIKAFLSYDELWENSDFVVIAEPVTKTADTPEKTYFTGVVTQHDDGTQSEVEAIGVETVFRSLAVLKGDQATKQFVLHHYREAKEQSPNVVTIGGPLIVAFDPDNRNESGVLLFLVIEDDGRFAPYGGQTDPGGRAIFALEMPQ